MIQLQGLAEKRILLVDDEKEIVELMEAVLRKEGFQQIETASTGTQAIRLCRTYQPDGIVLDIMLPDIDGLEVCRQIREFSHTPIIFLSARSDDLDKLLGLGIGGDDYVTKPFSPKEVAFRLKAQFRRNGYFETGLENTPEVKTSPDDPVYSFGEVRVDTARCEVTRAGQPVTLTAKEYQLLVYLAQNPNRIHSKERICDKVWGETYLGLDNTITVHIHNLREKIEPDPSNPVYIQTVIGLGYKLCVQG